MAKLHINIPEDIKEKIFFVAEKNSRSMNFIVNEALKKYLVKKIKKSEQKNDRNN